MAQTKVTGDLIADGAITAAKLGSITTDNISEGTALYYTDARVGNYLTTNSYATESFVTTGYLPLTGGTLTGNITATAFIGDGSQLTGISTSPTLDEVTTNGATTTNAITTGNVTVNGNLSVTGTVADSGGDLGTSGQVLSSTGSGTNWVDVGSDYDVQSISTNTTAVKDTLYVLTASVTLTLPASPSVGDKVAVSNMSGTTTPVIARNGNLLIGLAEDFTFDAENVTIEFIYSGATDGWIMLADAIFGTGLTSGGGGTIDGSGTANTITKWSDADTITDSGITDDGTTVTITGDVSIADKIIHTGDTNTAIRFPAADTVTIETAGSERLRVSSIGNVGIGTSVAPTHAVLGLTFDTTQNASAIQLGNNSGTGSAGGSLLYASSQNVLEFYTYTGAVGSETYSQRMVINFNGNVGIGTSSPAVKLDVVGQVRASTGILFGSDTAAANALDDYEEGTWTPVLNSFTKTGGGTYTNTGTYTKIGRLVYILGVITMAGGAKLGNTSVGNANVTGLPFAPAIGDAINTWITANTQLILGANLVSDTTLFAPAFPNTAANHRVSFSMTYQT